MNKFIVRRGKDPREGVVLRQNCQPLGSKRERGSKWRKESRYLLCYSTTLRLQTMPSLPRRALVKSALRPNFIKQLPFTPFVISEATTMERV